MNIEAPSTEQLAQAAAICGITLDQTRIAALQRLTRSLLDAYRLLAQYHPQEPPPSPTRDPGAIPAPADNPHGAWYRRTEIRGAASGPLHGRRVALKDNIFLAGVPMANGNALIDGWMPDFDATVVTRLLDAGAVIAGKAVCENLCFSGNSFTSTSGPVHNPHRRGYSAGGSSSGCGALVAAGDVDLAIGGDQGGSIRIPAALCGIYGMKPTFGLVPYTGAMPIEPTIDHLGPMTANVADNALLLEVIAGDDGIDPRQRQVVTQRYTDALGQPLHGLRIAVVEEGFQQPDANDEVNLCVRAAATTLRKLGAQVESISMPLHLQASQLCRPILVEGAIRTLFQGDGFGTGRHDLYPLSLTERFHAWRDHTDSLSESTRVILIAGTHLMSRHGAHFYARAMNAGRDLRRHYDTWLQRFDLLLMPTTPTHAQPLPDPGADAETLARASFGLTVNTFPFNVTGHPAMSVPCGQVDGLPVGMMLVGRHFHEATIYRAAHAHERAMGAPGR